MLLWWCWGGGGVRGGRGRGGRGAGEDLSAAAASASKVQVGCPSSPTSTTATVCTAALDHWDYLSLASARPRHPCAQASAQTTSNSVQHDHSSDGILPVILSGRERKLHPNHLRSSSDAPSSLLGPGQVVPSRFESSRARLESHLCVEAQGGCERRSSVRRWE